MSYESERTKGTQITNIDQTTLTKLARVLTGEPNLNWGGTHIFTNNDTMKLNGVNTTFKNTETGYTEYNLYDFVAGAVAAGYSFERIDAALETVFNQAAADDKEEGFRRNYRFAKNQVGDGSVARYLNQNTVPVLNKITEQIPGSYIKTLLNKGGDDYTHVLVYKDAAGKEYEIDIDAKSILDANGQIIESKYNNWMRDQGLQQYTNSSTNIQTNTTGQAVFAEKVKEALDKVNTNVNSYNDLTPAEREAIKAALPGTNDLTAWNKINNSTVSDSVAAGLAADIKPDLVERYSLKELQDIANAKTTEQLGITDRNINNQKLQLLQQIQRDPELYDAVTKQLRADNAAGTIAGQRAANAQQLAAQADATYDSSAAELYKSLFTGDTAVADAARANAYGNQTAASNEYFTAALNNASKAARSGQISQQQFAEYVEQMLTAMETDTARYANEVLEAQTAADGRSSEIVDRITGSVSSQIEASDAALRKVAGLLDVGESYLAQGADGSADVSAAIEALKSSLTSGTPGTGGYKVVSAGPYDKTELLDNKAYNEIVNDPRLQKYLDPETINALIGIKSLDDIKKQFGLIDKDTGADYLTEAGMNALYEGYAKEANTQSDKVFNQAQRAYIAAVTAGDAKTTEQLTKLAASAGASKSNLYATSALANQFKQQAGLNNTGRQLSTDYLNQIASNKLNLNQAASDATGALTKYLGNGADSYDQGTLYGIKNMFDQTSVDYLKGYGALNKGLMSSTQLLNNYRVGSNVDSYNRLIKAAGAVTGANLDANLNNIANKGTAATYGAEVEALLKQAQAT